MREVEERRVTKVNVAGSGIRQFTTAPFRLRLWADRGIAGRNGCHADPNYRVLEGAEIANSRIICGTRGRNKVIAGARCPADIAQGEGIAGPFARCQCAINEASAR